MNYLNQLGSSTVLGPEFLKLSWIILPILIWSIAWKGYSLWLSARRGEKWWFIALLILNTVGIFEIFYIFGIARNKDHKGE